MTQTITPNELETKIHSGAKIHLVDVRTGPEYRSAHVEIAKNLPLDRLSREALENLLGPNPGEIHIICQSGARATKACDLLAKSGEFQLINVEGGTGAWIAAGLPVIRGKKVMSLERQVRIAAGTLVFLGVVLGVVIHPVFYGLAGLIGAGLIFAGITDTCGMGMVIARMPWNRQ